MKKHLARREFLKQAARGIGFLGVGSTLFDSLATAFLQKAYAETVGGAINPSGYYIHLTMPGAPPRWMFDSILAPGGITNSNYIQGSYGTVLDISGTKVTPRYHVEKHVVGGQSVYLPPVWNMGQARPFSELLPNTVFIRGVDMEINSHNLSNGRQTAPLIGSYSINGVVADRAQRAFPSIVDTGSGGARAFKSKTGLSPNAIDLSNANPVSQLLLPFKNYMGDRSVHSATNVSSQQALLKQFEQYALDNKLTKTALPQMYDNAMDLIANDIFKLSDKWTVTVAKYRKLIDDALQVKKGDLPGLFDKKVPVEKSGSFAYSQNNVLSLTDARDMVAPTMALKDMATNFAIAEILIDKATANMSLSFRGLSGVANGKGTSGITHDQHNVGNVVSTMMTTLFYRAFLSCLTEFVAVLKTQGLFDRTVIHIANEFNRTPKTDGSGADHGVSNSNVTLISGMIGQNSVIGNIQVASSSTKYSGTIGVAAPYEIDGSNRPIQVNDVARTITTMLGVDEVVTNGRPLLEARGTLWATKNRVANNE